MSMKHIGTKILAGVLVAAGILYPVYGILLTPMLAVTVIALSCIMPVKG